MQQCASHRILMSHKDYPWWPWAAHPPCFSPLCREASPLVSPSHCWACPWLEVSPGSCSSLGPQDWLAGALLAVLTCCTGLPGCLLYQNCPKGVQYSSYCPAALHCTQENIYIFSCLLFVSFTSCTPVHTLPLISLFLRICTLCPCNLTCKRK